MKETKLANLTFGHVIRFVRELAILVLIVALCIKIFWTDFGQVSAKLTASEIVSILLAFFSIALSAAFYFAATSQSNQFYDNVNNFTNDTSTLLGRLDEQVKGVSGQQSEIKQSIERGYLKGSNKEIDQERKDIKKKQQETEVNRNKLVSELLEKTQLAQEEKEQFKERIQENEKKRLELREKKGRLDYESEKQVRDYTRSRIEKLGLETAAGMEPDELLLSIARKEMKNYRRDLYELGFTKKEVLEDSEDITAKGEEMVAIEREKLVADEDDS